MTWYSTTQEADIRAWLIEEDMTLWGCRTVQAPIHDKDEMVDDMRSVTAQEHKWIRSNSMGYYAVQTRWDIAYEINRIAQMLESPTQGTLLKGSQESDGIPCRYMG